MVNEDFCLKLSSCGKSIFLRFDDKHFLEDMLTSDFIRKYIPSPAISRGSRPGLPLINVKKSKEFVFSGGYPVFYYSGENYHDVLFVSEYLLERVRQENGMYSIHSSCAEKNNLAVLLFGWKDTGKTSVAIHLTTNYGFGFVSEGRTVVDTKHDIAGRIHYLEEDNDFLKEKYKFSENCLDISKICRVSDRNVNLRLLVYPQITLQPLEMRRWDDDKSSYHMYEQFSYVIRGVAKNINDYSCPLDSIDTSELARKRALFVKKLVGDVRVIQIRGRIDDICESIDSLMQ